MLFLLLSNDLLVLYLMFLIILISLFYITYSKCLLCFFSSFLNKKLNVFYCLCYGFLANFFFFSRTVFVKLLI